MVCATSKGSDQGAQWLSGRVLDSRPRGRGFKPHLRHCVVVLEQLRHIYPSLVLVQPRKTHPCLTERLLMGRKESNQANKQRLRPACTYAQSDLSLCKSLNYFMNIKLLTRHHMKCLSLKGGCTGLSESIHVKIPHC